MRVLFSTVSSAGYMAPPRLGDEQVNCGPDWENEKKDGRVISFRTPVGAYDLAALAARLPPEQKPDVVVCLVDACRRNMPRNLRAFKCPRVLLVGDTHHMQSPLTGMLNYIAAETFDRIVLLYDRHHAGIFRTAGVKNLFWFPGLTFPHDDATVKAARAAQRQPCVAFVGQTGKSHPRRSALLSTLSGTGIPLRHETAGQKEGLRVYGSSLIGLNSSLNGDLNLRIFEILATGGALLTDRLAPDAGMGRLFPAAVGISLYDDINELKEHAARLLADVGATESFGAAGARWFDEHLGEECRLRDFRRLAINGLQPSFADFDEVKTYFGGDVQQLRKVLPDYEEAQEWQRTESSVTVPLQGAAASDDLVSLYATLSRVRIGGAPAQAPGRVAAPSDGVACGVNGRRFQYAKASRDLLLTHLEINRRHGTGVLVKRYFANADEYVCIRSQSHYGGETDFGGEHFALDQPALTGVGRIELLKGILGDYRIRRILVIPFFESDIIHALAAQLLTGAPLCTFIMDDQILHGSEKMRELAAQLFARSRLRLVISPEMQSAYEQHFGLSFAVMPPVVTSVAERQENCWRSSVPPVRHLVVGNIWTSGQLGQLRDLARAGRLSLDWIGGGHAYRWMPTADELRRDGIHRMASLAEPELAARIARMPLVIVPSGMLDGSEDNEWLTRLSLPSRMPFILTQTHTPMLVLGSPETCAARFVLTLGIGMCCPYEPDAVVDTVRRMMEPAMHAVFVARARAVARAFVMPDAGEWIWSSLEAGYAKPAPFEGVYGSYPHALDRRLKMLADADFSHLSRPFIAETFWRFHVAKPEETRALKTSPNPLPPVSPEGMYESPALKRLAALVEGRTVGILLPGASIKQFSDHANKLARLPVVWMGVNHFSVIEDTLLKPFQREFAIVYSGADGEVARRHGQLAAFLGRPGSRLLITRPDQYEEHKGILAPHEASIAMARLPPLWPYPNTLTAALRLLVQCRPRRIVLFGADGDLGEKDYSLSTYFQSEVFVKEKHVVSILRDTLLMNGHLPRILKRWNERLNGACPEIINCSPGTHVRAFPVIDYNQAVDALAGNPVNGRIAVGDDSPLGLPACPSIEEEKRICIQSARTGNLFQARQLALRMILRNPENVESFFYRVLETDTRSVAVAWDVFRRTGAENRASRAYHCYCRLTRELVEASEAFLQSDWDTWE